MSRQNKLRNKRKHAESSSTQAKAPSSGSRYPHRQAAPPWVRNGKRVPKAVREREAKLKAEREAAEREAKKEAKRDTARVE